jgi:hypothetical protein
MSGRCCLLRALETRRVRATLNALCNVSSDFDRSCIDLSAHPTLGRDQERPITSSATASLIRRSSPVMHRRFPLGRCTATGTRSSRPGRSGGSFPLTRSAALLGFMVPFAGLLPHRGGGSFLIRPGPPACSSTPRASIRFRRVGPPLQTHKKKHESRQFCGESRASGLASGLHSRLRSASSRPAASVVADDKPRRPFLPWAFASLRYAGTTSVHSVGLDPARIIRSRRRYPRRRSARGVTSASASQRSSK